jgi:putative CocE/NonD family hydrolase
LRLVQTKGTTGYPKQAAEYQRRTAVPETYDVKTLIDVKAPMRDGVQLSADIYLPKAPGPFPTVLVRTPYDNSADGHVQNGKRFASKGYAFVVQDLRGRFDSAGDYYPYLHEAEDGFDTDEWIGQQAWSNGKIGTSGGSDLGLTQWISAPLASRYLTCMAPRVIGADQYSGLFYPSGAFQLFVIFGWAMRNCFRTRQPGLEPHEWRQAMRTLPLRDMDRVIGRDLPYWKDWIDHAAYDDYWEPLNIEQRLPEVAAPAFNMGGWYDINSRETFINFNALRLHGKTPEAQQSKLIVGPWPHSLSASTVNGDVDFGPDSKVDIAALELRWFDYWLKGDANGIVDEPPLRLFIMGTNVWRDEHEWPLARTDWQRWYLHSRGHANTLLGDGELASDEPAAEPADTYVYHPEYPVPTFGGSPCCDNAVVPWAAQDQRDVEMRRDVLCYTSAPLKEDLEVTGPVQLILYATTDGRDTDWTAKLVDVRPDRYAMILCNGIIRARCRESLSQPTLLEPGKVYRYEISVGVTGIVFQQGHRLRLEVSSSNFPLYDRNLNTGNRLGQDAELRVALQTILHSREHPSHLVLPVIPAAC